jgi:hypothetical protein
MITASLTAAALLTLVTGQSVTDRQAYAIYEAKLAALTTTGSASASPAAAVASSARPVASGVAALAAPAAIAPGGCILVPGSGNGATTSDCTSCHVSYQAQHSHPVDVYQDAGRSSSLRRAAEVVRRGVFLSDGKVTCLSCHDGNSTWKYKIALPPDAQLKPRVKPGNPMTYETVAIVRTAATMPSGSDVSPTPLCMACHGFD